LIYFARDRLLDGCGRFFSWTVCGSSSAGRKTADLGVSFYKLATEVLELAELRHLSFAKMP
jgi:hypothetical protein